MAGDGKYPPPRKMKDQKEKQINVRLPHDEAVRVAAIVEKTGMPAVNLARSLLLSACDLFESMGSNHLSFPLRVVETQDPKEAVQARAACPGSGASKGARESRAVG